MSSNNHNARLHTPVLACRPDAYEHLSPGLVGNMAQTFVSELAGRSTVLVKNHENGLDLSADEVIATMDRKKTLGQEGLTSGGDWSRFIRRRTVSTYGSWGK